MKKLAFILFSSLLLLLGSCKDPCDDLDCNDGTCIEGICICDQGFTGTNCNKGLCDDVNCNDGTCIEGICNCDEGYEGTNCESEIRAKYYGVWTGPNMCDNDLIALETVTLTITASENNINDLTMEISVEGDIDVPLPPENATLFGNAFETGPTTVDLGFGMVTFSSDGIFKSGTEMSLDFVVSADEPLPITINCTADLVKQ